MKTIHSIESIGVLLKEEILQTVEHHVWENSLVLESIEPFPGYHGENMPTGPKPDSLFLITDKTYPIESIFRISQHLCCEKGFVIDACPVEITIHNVKYPGIRIRGLKNYALIADVQHCFIEKNILFQKKKMLHSPGMMRIIKIFSLEMVDESIFRDLDDPNTFYLLIPYHFKWDLFKTVTQHIKNNMDNSNFDCASCFIYQKDLLEFVRIYIHNPEISRLKLIREKYIEEIARVRDDAM